MSTFQPKQSELGIVNGVPLPEMPEDLFIPPQALEICLETFTGPMDLLLYLIKKQNINILDLEVSKITDQYIDYINLMDSLNFELAAEYLVMAATLAEIKSRMLLPKVDEQDDESDPRLDIGGIDSAHKLALLSCLAFGTTLNFKAVKTEGIDNISIEDIQEADLIGYKIKLLRCCE